MEFDFMRTLRIATRESPLALWQAHYVQQCLQHTYPQLKTQILGMTTTGDKRLGSLSKQGGKGLFVKELEEALLTQRADIAVHSMKDVPMVLPEGLEIAAILTREDPRDAFVANDYADLMALPQGAKVGTASLRRQSQLRHLRPDLHVGLLRGNLATRLRKLDLGEFDAIILAAAGLMRLGQTKRIRAYFDPIAFVPAIGQGALGIETRSQDGAIKQLVACLNDPVTQDCLTAERTMGEALGGNCQVPVGGYATCQNGQLHLLGVVIAPNGQQVVRAEISGRAGDAGQLGMKLAQVLLQQGAQQILHMVNHENG